MTCVLNQIAPLPCCASSYKLGKFAAAKTGVYAIFKNLTTNNTFALQFNTEADGTIVIEPQSINFPTGQPFEIYFQSSINKAVRLPFTIDGSDPIEFIRTQFLPIQKTDGDQLDVLQAEAVLEE